ncbi:VOC family protein [Streptomyces uncialis]|uniref:VOC family protein n=1 Tax=Streptomyces uncialis TaxID=1048205 RepID=UPI003663ABFA
MNSDRSIHETKSEAVRAATGTRQDAGVWPTLQAHDAPALIDFLVCTVGFRRTAVYQDGDIVEHAQLDWPEGGGVMLGSYRPDSPVTLRPGTAGAYVVTDHVDALYRRLADAGVRITREIQDRPYGSRGFTIEDPEGNAWAFGTYRGEPA